MSRADDAGLIQFALLGGFRRAEAGKFYCLSCLVTQVRQRGVRAFSLAAVRAAVQGGFKRSDELQLKLGRTCEACQKSRPFIRRREPDHGAGMGPPP
jgi:hypothetical protein